MNKTSLPQGMRDFTPLVLARRQHILDIITSIFCRYGFQALETPAMEYISTLTGKYGDDGEQLIYRILNSGDYLKDYECIGEESKKIANITQTIASKGLRYDLTVPLARYVSNHKHDIAFPFRRFQVQPVWRADRPQKGRYREFHQCDADVIGTDSLLCEAEMIAMTIEVLDSLGLQKRRIRLNHRGILSGIVQYMGQTNENIIFNCLDKWDKIGKEGVRTWLLKYEIAPTSIEKLFNILAFDGNLFEYLDFLDQQLKASKKAQEGIKQFRSMIHHANLIGISPSSFELDTTLARGLSYYTGTIFEATLEQTSLGSVGGGGRYDHLTSALGLSDTSGVGLSFGIDRLYEAMETLDLLPSARGCPSKILVAHLDEPSMYTGIELVSRIRKHDIASEIYPHTAKLKQQLSYANKNAIPFVIIIGEEERQTQKFTLRDMRKGDQQKLSVEDIIQRINV